MGGLNVYLLGGVAYSQDIVTLDLSSLASIKRITARVIIPTPTISFARVWLSADYDLSGSKVSTNLEVTRIQGSGDIKTNPTPFPLQIIDVGYFVSF